MVVRHVSIWPPFVLLLVLPLIASSHACPPLILVTRPMPSFSTSQTCNSSMVRTSRFFPSPENRRNSAKSKGMAHDGAALTGAYGARRPTVFRVEKCAM